MIFVGASIYLRGGEGVGKNLRSHYHFVFTITVYVIWGTKTEVYCIVY